jgi:ribulose-phosphate 3-epimerase
LKVNERPVLPEAPGIALHFAESIVYSEGMHDEQHLPPWCAPSLLSANFTQVARAVELVESAGCPSLHLDVMDGRFVPNLTFGPKMIADIRAVTNLLLDVHLMIDQPERSITQYAEAGADWLTFHPEACIHQHRLAVQIKELGKQVGIAIVPSTPVASIVELLPIVDLVLIMSVNPGFGGQALIPQVLPKIVELRRLRALHSYGYRISIDGGVNEATLAAVGQAGPDVVVAGNAFFLAADSKIFAQKAVATIKQYRSQGFQPNIDTRNKHE